MSKSEEIRPRKCHGFYNFIVLHIKGYQNIDIPTIMAQDFSVLPLVTDRSKKTIINSAC
jgi:hypothetical protein